MEISNIGAAYDVAVAKKVQTSVRQEGENTLKLINSASPESTQLPPGVGKNLNIRA